MKTALIVAVASAAVTAGVLFQLHRGRAREFGRLRWENSQLRLNVMQQAAGTRTNASVPVAPVDTPETARPTARGQAAVPTSSPLPLENYRNEGQDTPLATLQTFAWACDRGDVATVGKLLHLDPGARNRAEAYLATLPADVQAQWQTVDEMAAAMLAYQGMAVPFPNADVLATATTEGIRGDRVVLHLPNTLRRRTEYQKTDSGWKYVITDEMAADYIQRASQAAR